MTEVGIAGPGPVHAVGPAGTLGPISEPPVVDWWVGADDRWHVASAEAAVRQGLADDGVTVETRLRIPGGDAVQRVAAVPDGDRAVVVVEVENASPVPVALAMVVDAGAGRTPTVAADTIAGPGGPILRAGRPIARALVGASGADVLAGVQRGDAVPPAELGAAAGSVAAAVLPLPHTAVARFAVAAGAGRPTLAAPDTLPTTAAVARGWLAHLEGSASLVVPDERLSAAVAAARRHLLSGAALPTVDPFWRAGVDPWVAPIAAAALDAWGHRPEGLELLLAASGPDDPTEHVHRPADLAGALLWAWAERLERAADPELEAAVIPWVEDVAVGLLSRRRRWRGRPAAGGDGCWRPVGLAAAGSLLSRSGDQGLGADIVDALPTLTAELPAEGSSPALGLGGNRLGRPAGSLVPWLAAESGVDRAGLGAVASAASPTGALARGQRSQHPLLSALLLLAVRRAAVDEPDGTGGPIAIVPAPDPAWLGAPLEGHRLPVTGGTVSFGVRWHGSRPALLWEVEGRHHAVEVRAPGLDPTWRGHDPRGEALLAEPPGPGGLS